MMTRLGWGAIALGLALSSTAAADPKADAATAYADGQQKYVAGDYAGAAVQFSAAYKLDADPAYLFNLAQAYRLGKQCAAASTAYRQFLADVPDAPNATTVRGYLTETDACARDQAVVVPPAPPPAPTEPSPPPPPPAPSGRSNTLAYGAFGVAALGVVAGVVFHRRVGMLEDERATLCSGGCTWTEALSTEERGLEERGQRASALAITSYAIGGAALVGGIVLMMRGRGGERDPRAAQVVPTGNGALVRWAF